MLVAAGYADRSLMQRCCCYAEGQCATRSLSRAIPSSLAAIACLLCTHWRLLAALAPALPATCCSVASCNTARNLLQHRQQPAASVTCCSKASNLAPTRQLSERERQSDDAAHRMKADGIASCELQKAALARQPHAGMPLAIRWSPGALACLLRHIHRFLMVASANRNAADDRVL